MGNPELKTAIKGVYEYKFDVFISYRHAELDSAVAGYLQKSLEHYHIPREIQKKCGKKNIRRVFRDEEELGVASDLFSQIEQNLVQSEFLLVICSPRILESKWCMREIETFIKYRGRENVLAVLIEGEPETAFPPILTQEGEPLAADLRGRNVREVLRHARQRMPRLVAPLIYCSYDELYQRHRVYKMRRLLALAGAAAAISMVFGGATVYQNREISRNYQGKLENQSRYLAQTAMDLLKSGDRDAALLVALEALPKGSGDTSRPYVAEARIALEKALYAYNMNYRYQLQPIKRLEHQGSAGECMDFNEEENVLLTADTRIYIWDADTCENICCWGEERSCRDARLVGNHSVAVLAEKGIFCFDYLSGQILWEWDFPVCEAGCPGTEFLWSYDAVSNRILCGNRNLCLHTTEDGAGREITGAHCFYLLDASNGESRSWVPAELYLPLKENPYGTVSLREEFFCLAPGGERMALCYYTDAFTEDTLLVLEPGKDESSFRREYSGKMTSAENILDYVSWLDEDTLATVRSLEGGRVYNVRGYPKAWLLECWDMNTGTLRFSHEDTCLALRGDISVRRVLPEKDGEDTVPLVDIVYDNVAVCLDWNTGERYSRVEDRSVIVLDHIWNSNARVMVTADNYLFSASPTQDSIVAPVYNAYHYYLGLNTIQKALWGGGRAFFLAGGDVYCYGPVIDSSYTLLEEVPAASFFTGDSTRLLTLGWEGNVYLYDTENFDLLWQDVSLDIGLKTNAAAFADDRFAVYIDREGAGVKIYSLQDGSAARVELDDFLPALEGSAEWQLRAVGGSNVLVWNGERISTYSPDDPDSVDLGHTAVWLVDAEQGKVTGRWTYRQILDQFSDSFDETGMGIRLKDCAATRDAGYVLFPCEIDGYLQGENRWESQRVDRRKVIVWDREKEKMVSLPEEVAQGMAWELTFGSYFEQDGWLSPLEDTAVFYNEERGCLQVTDLARGTVLRELAVDGISSMEVSFTPDGNHLIFQDAGMHLCVYDWREGEYTQREVSPENGYLKFAFSRDGKIMNAAGRPDILTTDTSLLYRRTGEGSYKLDTSISFCGYCDGKTAVVSDGIYPRLYHVYTLDELIAQAGEILKGRELTEEERRSYLID